MNRRFILCGMVLVCLFAFPSTCPAPLVYTPGEGWSYESVGGAKWKRNRAKDQFDVAQEFFDNKEYGTASKAARRTVKVWPLSDYAPKAQYLMARCYEARKQDEKAFKAYQTLIEKYPKLGNYDEVLHRQYEIAIRFLNGQWRKLWGVIPFFSSMDLAARMFADVVKNGPYSAIAPEAQMDIGAAREKQASFFNKTQPFVEAIQAYETAADRYHDRKDIQSTAIFRAGLAYYHQAGKAEYDQSLAGSAISTFQDFTELFPEDPRVQEANTLVANLKEDQARGNYEIARWYEKKKKWDGAVIYYNEVLLTDPKSVYADQARNRIETIKIARGKTRPKE